jgi:enoyl-CoA hydratase
MLEAVYESFIRVGSLKVPVIAAVRGAAIGAGMNLLLAADVRVVAENARLLSGFLRIGIHPGGGHFNLMSRLAGREAAVAMAICGEEIDGRRAADIGLAWEALPDDQVEARAFELAESAAKDPVLARIAILSSRRLSDVPWNVATEAERSAQMWSLRRRYSTDQEN